MIHLPYERYMDKANPKHLEYRYTVHRSITKLCVCELMFNMSWIYKIISSCLNY